MIDQVQKKKIFMYLLLHAFWMYSRACRLFKLTISFRSNAFPSPNLTADLKNCKKYINVSRYEQNSIDGKRHRVKFWYILNILYGLQIQKPHYSLSHSFHSHVLNQKAKITVWKVTWISYTVPVLVTHHRVVCYRAALCSPAIGSPLTDFLPIQ